MPEAHLVRRLGMEKIRVWEGKPEQREEGSDWCLGVLSTCCLTPPPGFPVSEHLQKPLPSGKTEMESDQTDCLPHRQGG